MAIFSATVISQNLQYPNDFGIRLGDIILVSHTKYIYSRDFLRGEFHVNNVSNYGVDYFM